MAINGVETGGFKSSFLNSFRESKFHARYMNGPSIAPGWDFIPANTGFGLISSINGKFQNTDSIPAFSGTVVYVQSTVTPFEISNGAAVPTIQYPVKMYPSPDFNLITAPPAISIFLSGNASSAPYSGFIYQMPWGGNTSMGFRPLTSVFRAGIYSGVFGQSSVSQPLVSQPGQPLPSSCSCQLVSADLTQIIDVTPPGAGQLAEVFTNMTLNSVTVFGRKTSFFIQINQGTRPDPGLVALRNANPIQAYTAAYKPRWVMNLVSLA